MLPSSTSKQEGRNNAPLLNLQTRRKNKCSPPQPPNKKDKLIWY